jgi:hypothetical protein
MVLFFQNLISWFLGVLITYIFIQFTVNYLFGISGVEKDTDKKTDKDKDKDKDVQPKP